MIKIIHQSTPVAKKDYYCNACEFLFELNHPTELGLTFSEYRSVVKAKKDRYKILKGQKYIRQFNADSSGNSWTFRGRPDINAICQKHKLYDEDL